MRDDRARLLDIQEAIERIERYATLGRTAFERDLPSFKRAIAAMLSELTST